MQFHRNGKTSTTDLRYYSSRYRPVAFKVQQLPSESTCPSIDFQNFTSFSPMQLDKEDMTIQEFILRTTAQCPCTNRCCLAAISQQQSQDTQTSTNQKLDSSSQHTETDDKISQTIVAELIDKLIQIDTTTQQQATGQQTEPVAQKNKQNTTRRMRVPKNNKVISPQESLQGSIVTQSELLAQLLSQVDQQVLQKQQADAQNQMVHEMNYSQSMDNNLQQVDHTPQRLLSSENQQAFINNHQQHVDQEEHLQNMQPQSNRQSQNGTEQEQQQYFMFAQQHFSNCYCPKSSACQETQTAKASERRRRPISNLYNSDSSNESDIEDYLCR